MTTPDKRAFVALLKDLMSAHADFTIATESAWDEALRKRNEALNSVLQAYAAGREGQPPVAKVSADQLLDAIGQSIGIYPASFNGVPRTERQEGFNQAMREVLKVASELQTHPAPKADAAADLHAAIMNLRCDVPPEQAESTFAKGYKFGYRDARHAAAELALAASHAPGAEKDAERYRLIRSECWVTVPDDEDKLADTALDEWCDKTLAEYAAMSGGKGAG